MANTAGPVIVGIDGSRAAITAAVWAVEEAISRDVPLRLVSVIHVAEAPLSPAEDFELETEYAEDALRAASAAIEVTGKQVKVDTAVLRGDVDAVLIEESRDAAMICVGSVGIGRVASLVLGSTAATLARCAQCPVAIIRSDGDSQPQQGDWVAVVIDDDPDNDSVIEWAMEEARLRNAAVLGLVEIPHDKLARRIDTCLRRYPDVQVDLVSARAGAARHLHGHNEPVQLVVIGTADADQVTRLIGPHGRPILPHADCSVLVVRR